MVINNFVLTDINPSKVVSSDVMAKREFGSYDLYNEMEGIKPVDKDVGPLVYMDDYVEKGLSVKPSISGVKKLWKAYNDVYRDEFDKKVRSDNMYTDMYNPEINVEEKNPMLYGAVDGVTNNSFVLDNFDELYDRLAERVVGANKYIDDLKVMRDNLNNGTDALELEKKSLQQEKKEFNAYREEQMKLIGDEKKRIEDNSKKLQDLIDSFEDKLNTIL